MKSVNVTEHLIIFDTLRSEVSFLSKKRQLRTLRKAKISL